ncbi:hypothetical protein WH50_09770 [Pokkaliibacter plantistimulans]|uniref:DUF1127 domain-containing protein n=1 Tax=Pokkaliibacter plantistimulans TaxID=1635171 RepID=A0ABX5LXT1_9GAMM|nr:hypothetical protein [Pokkaliibacter plantistimulans]PXF31474.1 hypothetical protein WH50_09770 [Pokkaliibacter plantistimulans]
MFLAGLIRALHRRLTRAANDEVTYQQMLHLDDHLLKDIGVYRDGGRIRSLSGESSLSTVVTTTPASKPAAAQPVSAVKQVSACC